MNGRFHCIPASAAAFFWLTLAVTPTYAQVESSEGGRLEEIVVTSQRRAESLQDVPLSVAAFGQADITRLAISSVDDIGRLTPGLAVNGATVPTLTIRGIASAQGAATTGIYLDDTPIQVRQFGQAGGSLGSAFPAVFDLERIEVLRGPQGTLFGAGSEGGAVRFITPQPSLTVYSGLERGEFGFNSVGAPSSQMGGSFGGPILQDRLAFRLSAYVQEDGGWIDRRPYPGSTVTDKNVNSARTSTLSGALAWALTDALTVTPKVFYQSEKNDGIQTYWRALSNPSNDDFVTGDAINRPFQDQLTLPSLKIEWRAGPVTLVSNTSYMDRTFTLTDDDTFVFTELLSGNFTGPNTLSQAFHKNSQQQFTQEIRLQSADSDSALSWVVGAFYQRVNQRVFAQNFSPGLDSVTLALYGLTVQQLLGSPILPDGDVFFNDDSIRDTQKAGFAQVNLRLWDKLTATAGLRYSKLGYSFTGFQDGAFNGGPAASSQSSSASFTSPKFGLDYKSGDGLMFYTSAAKGFRPGAANAPLATFCGADLAALGYASEPKSYDPDQVWSYEIGAKGDSLGKRFLWDASVFYVKWTQRQTNIYLPSCGAYVTINIGAAVSKGFELQAKYALSEHLTLEGSLGYDNAYISQTVPTPGGSGNVVTKGEGLGTSPWHGFVGAEYEFAPLPNTARMYVRVDDSYTNSYRAGSPQDATFDPADSGAPAINIMSGRLGIRRDSWDLSLFTKNLLNAHPVIPFGRVVETSDRLLDRTVAPRVIGITAVYRF